MNDLRNKTYQDRINDIRDNLYIGGGIEQAKNLLYHLMDSTVNLAPAIQPSDMLSVLSNLYDNYTSIIKYHSFIKVDKCFSLINKKTYPCLTYNMEFVLRKYGTPEWSDVEYVMPFFDVNRANDIINHE